MNNLCIGNVKLDGNVLLAPMAGFTSLPFRMLARKYGASLTCTEMVSAKACVYGNQKTLQLLQVAKNEKPCACQIFGHEPDIIAKAIQLPALQKFDIIDINMGCPAPKIINNGDGSALLKNIELARCVIESAVSSTNKPITVKFRIGYTKDDVIAVEFAKMCELAGAKMITIHGRTTDQGYAGKADMEIIKKCKEAVSIPVVANGDCLNLDDYNRIIEQTGADGVMIGRAALGNPEIFGLIKGKRIKTDKRKIIFEYLDNMQEYFGEKQAVLESRAHLMYFLKGAYCGTKIKTKIMQASSIDEIKSILSVFYEDIRH